MKHLLLHMSQCRPVTHWRHHPLQLCIKALVHQWCVTGARWRNGASAALCLQQIHPAARLPARTLRSNPDWKRSARSFHIILCDGAAESGSGGLSAPGSCFLPTAG